MHRIPIVLLFFLLCQDVTGQSLIRGRLIESVSGLSLPNATVTVNDKTGKSIAGAQSSKDGSFKVALPAGAYYLVISFTGYQPVNREIDIRSDTVIDLKEIRLSPVIKDLKAVKVLADKPFITMSAGKLTMNVAESGIVAGSNAWEILRQAPGVQATEEARLSLNGKEVRVYIDGRPAYLDGEPLKNLLSAMQAMQIDKVELISNPSARYDASGGAVINIRTVKLVKPGYNGVYTALIGFNRYFKYSTGIDLNYKTGKLNLYGGYDYTHNANLYQPVFARVGGHQHDLYMIETESDYRSRFNQNIRAGADFGISKNATLGVSVKGLINRRDRSVEGDTRIGSATSVDSIISTSTSGTTTYRSPAINLFYKTTFDTSGKCELAVNADYYKYETEWRDSFSTRFLIPGQPYRPNQFRRDRSPMILDIYSASADYSQPFLDGNLDAGLKAVFVKTDNDVQWDIGDGATWSKDVLRTNYFIYEENIFAAYAAFTRSFGKWEAEAALRTEITKVKGHSVTLDSIFRRSYQDWFPTMSLTWHPNKKDQFSISYRKSIVRPLYSLVNPFVIFHGQFNYFEGNTNLRPMYDNDLELEYGFKNMIFVSTGYSQVKDYISSLYRQDNITGVSTEFYDNFSNRRSWFLRINGSKQINKYWYTATSVSMGCLYSRYATLPAAPSSMYCYFNTNNSFPIPKWKSKLELSGFFNVPYSNGYYRYQAYGMLNLAFSREILQRKATLRLNVVDLLKTNTTGYTALYGEIQRRYELPYNSRTINLAFTYKFGKAQIKRQNRKSNIESETGRIE